ncbi:GGDEF domain-containing protein [Marinicellulosiphila megalodicopiae]|uniref:GGDEF domain-containing protein n=1 Tax=Marinicellulosiphila megalodicopiae TaxID=2724896 RepID=UPI003BAE9F65
MPKLFNLINALVLIPIILFVCLLGSVFLVVFYPYYSIDRMYIEVNESNTIAAIEIGSEGFTVINKMASDQFSGFDCQILDEKSDPTCRLEIWITENKTKGIDLSKFEEMTVFGNFISPTSEDFLRVSLRNYEVNVNKLNEDPDTFYKFNLVELLKTELGPPIHLELNRLIVPNWWLTKVRDEDVKSSVDLTNVPMIEISTGSHPSVGSFSLRVSAIELKRSIFTIEQLYEYLLLFWAAILILSFLIISLFLGFRIWRTNKNEKILIEINDSLSERTENLELINKTDELTRVLNRNGMKQQMMLCLTNNWFPLTAVMVDIDFFKKINDKFGHQKGDVVLMNLGRILMDFTHDYESVSRFGGEEFIILMPNKNKAHFEHRLEKLRRNIESFDMGLGYPVTASIGVATANSKSEFKDVVEHADQALYQAKNNGRNCVRYFQKSKMN